MNDFGVALYTFPQNAFKKVGQQKRNQSTNEKNLGKMGNIKPSLNTLFVVNPNNQIDIPLFCIGKGITCVVDALQLELA